MPRTDDLAYHLRSLGRVLLGYSGGVDSSLLAVVARRALGRGDLLAVIGRSASYPAVQYEGAIALAHRFDVPVFEVDTDELDDPSYVANPRNRCYFCKSELWRRLGAVAAERGFTTIADGTNADDLLEHRPGAQAGRERTIRSPLADLGWTKADVRTVARELHIPIWDAPAAPCLASRIRHGVAVTHERLAQVERAEAFLRNLGIRGDLRVRHLGDIARIEVSPPELQRIQAAWNAVERELESLGFDGVELDPRGYRRGSLSVLGVAEA